MLAIFLMLTNLISQKKASLFFDIFKKLVVMLELLCLFLFYSSVHSLSISFAHFKKKKEDCLIDFYMLFIIRKYKHLCSQILLIYNI